MAILLFVLVTILGLVCGNLDENVEGGKCERIRLPLCQDLEYNWTSMPNLMGHTDQKEAEEAVRYNQFINYIKKKTIFNHCRISQRKYETAVITRDGVHYMLLLN